MHNKHLSIAAAIAAGPLVLAGCGSSSSAGDSVASESPTATASVGDRTAVNNSASGFDNFFDNNPTGSNILSILTGGYPDDINSCGASSSLNPVLITNLTSSPQTARVWVASDDTAKEAAFFAPGSPYTPTTASGCSAVFDWNTTAVQNVTIPPGQTAVAAIAAGGSGYNLVTDKEHYLSIGSGTEQWYDFWLHIDEFNTSFQNFELAYEETGGTNPNLNKQPGLLNVMQCDTSNGNIAVTNQFISNYGINDNAWTYNQNAPICLAFGPPVDPTMEPGAEWMSQLLLLMEELAVEEATKDAQIK